MGEVYIAGLRGPPQEPGYSAASRPAPGRRLTYRGLLHLGGRGRRPPLNCGWRLGRGAASERIGPTGG
jgi:hypothetical protein